MQQGHSTHGSWNGDRRRATSGAWQRTAGEGDRLDVLLVVAVDKTDAVAAQTGSRRHGDGKREIHGNGGVDRIATAVQQVATDLSCLRLIGRDCPKKTTAC